MSQATRQRVMKRLLGTLLGLLSAQVCCELGPSRMGTWKDLAAAVLLGVGEEGKKGLKSADFLSHDLRGHFFVLRCPSPMILLRFSSGVRGIEVEQSPPALSLHEGASSMLWCNFSAAPNTVQWFRQNPGGRLINLFYIPSGTKQIGRLTATTVTKERRSSLYISSSQTTDSAIYFCAVEPHIEHR